MPGEELTRNAGEAPADTRPPPGAGGERALAPAPEVEGKGAPGTAGPLDAALDGEESLAGPDRSAERVTTYWVIFLLLLGGSFLLRNDLLWSSTPEFHTMVEAIATLLAFIVGALALVRFYSRKQATFLFIGTGFLGAGFLDLNHVLLTSEWVMSARTGVSAQDLFAWSWTAERVFLSLFLAVSFLAWRRELKSGEGEAVHEGSVFATAVVLTLINLFFFEWVDLSRAHHPALPISRPAEFVPAVFFLMALAGFLAKGTWRRDAFEHWLIISLIISMLCHAGYMSMSEQRFDAMFDAAHLLKVASYVAILTGLLSSVYVTFRREGAVLQALTESNAALAREVEVRARTERAVEESRARLQEFLDNANDLIQSVDPSGRILYVNSAWKRVLGYTDEELERLSLFDIVNPTHRAFLESELARALEGGEARRFSVEYIAADGRVVILSGSAQGQFVGGKPVATQAILRDVTEQKKAERELAESRANLGALVENTGDAIWSVDREMRLITFNSAYALAIEAQTGREPRVGDLPADIYPERDVEWYEEMYRKTLAGDRHVALREDVVDGQLRYFELYCNPIQAFEGISGAVFFGKDVTARVRAEEALRVAKEEAVAANKAKSDFLANMSHELRTPLNSIIGFTNILLKNKDGRLNDKDLGFLNRVLSNGKHLLALINEVLDLAKVEAGRMELIIEDVDLAQLCVETVQQLEGQAKLKEGAVALIADVPDEVTPVRTDSAKLKQVIINLVGNALKFTHEGSVTVRLETAADGKTPTAIAVQDTGIGIPEDRLDAIFEAFQQAEAGTSRKYGGTGLGLALSRSICLLMGYDLIVESQVGKGSTFRIVMGERAKRQEKADDEGIDVLDDPQVEAPASSDGPDPAAASTHQETGAGAPAKDGPPASFAAQGDDGTVIKPLNFKVLVIDDEKDSRVLMVHYLEELGCEVITAPDGPAGILAARDHKPDLITLDLMMPGMTGWEVLKRLKADPEVRNIPVVICSIVAGEGRGRLLGAVDLITKPVEREDLVRVLWRHIARRRNPCALVVDDEPTQRMMVGQYLANLGLDVITAADGQEALEMVRGEAPDLVVLDLLMPVMDGLDFLKELRTDPAYVGLPVFVLTAKDLSEEDEQLLGELASAVVQKDEALERLGDLLGTVVDLSALAERDEQTAGAGDRES